MDESWIFEIFLKSNVLLISVEYKPFSAWFACIVKICIVDMQCNPNQKFFNSSTSQWITTLKVSSPKIPHLPHHIIACSIDFHSRQISQLFTKEIIRKVRKLLDLSDFQKCPAFYFCEWLFASSWGRHSVTGKKLNPKKIYSKQPTKYLYKYTFLVRGESNQRCFSNTKKNQVQKIFWLENFSMKIL